VVASSGRRQDFPRWPQLWSPSRGPTTFPLCLQEEVGTTSSLRGFYSDEGNAAAARNRVVAAGASRQTPATSHARGLTDSLLDLRHSPAVLSGACRARTLRGLGDTVKGPRLCAPLPHAETPPANRGTFTSTAGVEQAVPNYHYELRRVDVVVATGRLNREEPFEVGEAVVIGGQPGIVHAVYPQTGPTRATRCCPADRRLRRGCSTPNRRRGQAPSLSQ
jgi:hypothetical protein